MTKDKLIVGVSIMEKIKEIAIEVDTLKRCDTLLFTLDSISATVKYKEKFMGESTGVYPNSLSEFCAKQKEELINFLLEKIQSLENELAEL